MLPGDLVIRRVDFEMPDWKWDVAVAQRDKMGHGLILSKQMYGTPAHPCITVYYPQTGQIYDIAESLMEVISESR
jgi:hypothetical protein